MNWSIRKYLKKRKEREEAEIKEWLDSQPPSIVGQTIKFIDNDKHSKFINMRDNEIVIIGNKRTVKLWQKYFKSFV